MAFAETFWKGLTRTIDSIPGGARFAGTSTPLSLFSREQYLKYSKQTPNSFWEGYVMDGAGRATVDPGIRSIRRGAMLGLMGLGAANAVGFDPFGATSLITDAASLGFHGLAGATMYNMGGRAKLLGLGYLGATAVNSLRPGNNTGPL